MKLLLASSMVTGTALLSSLLFLSPESARGFSTTVPFASTKGYTTGATARFAFPPKRFETDKDKPIEDQIVEIENKINEVPDLIQTYAKGLRDKTLQGLEASLEGLEDSNGTDWMNVLYNIAKGLQESLKNFEGFAKDEEQVQDKQVPGEPVQLIFDKQTAVGGDGGEKFDMCAELCEPEDFRKFDGLRSVCIRYADLTIEDKQYRKTIQRISFDRPHPRIRATPLDYHKSYHTPWDRTKFKVDKDDSIVKIDVWTDDVLVNAIRFHTAKGVVSKLYGNPFVYSTEPSASFEGCQGSKLVGMHGRFGYCLDKVGFTFASMTDQDDDDIDNDADVEEDEDDTEEEDDDDDDEEEEGNDDDDDDDDEDEDYNDDYDDDYDYDEEDEGEGKEAEAEEEDDDNANDNDDSPDIKNKAVLAAEKAVFLARAKKVDYPLILELMWCSDELKADKEAVLAAVREDGDALKYASDELKADKEVVLAAVMKKGCLLEHASSELKADKEVVLAAVMKDKWTLEYASDELKADKEVVLAAVKQYGYVLKYASDELKADKEAVLVAVKKCGEALEHASDELKADKEVVLAAVKQYGYVLKYASDELKADKEAVLVAVKNFGGALEHASDELKADKEVVLAAVKQYGYVLKYASDELKGDKEAVLTALKTTGYALEHASDELKADKEVVAAAVKKTCEALEYAAPELRG